MYSLHLVARWHVWRCLHKRFPCAYHDVSIERTCTAANASRFRPGNPHSRTLCSFLSLRSTRVPSPGSLDESRHSKNSRGLERLTELSNGSGNEKELVNELTVEYGTWNDSSAQDRNNALILPAGEAKPTVTNSEREFCPSDIREQALPKSSVTSTQTLQHEGLISFDLRGNAQSWSQDCEFRSCFLEYGENGSGQDRESDTRPLPTRLRPKTDLSYRNVREREAAALVQGATTSTSAHTSVFRNHSGMRRLLDQFMQHETVLKTQNRPRDALDSQLLRIFTHENLQLLQRSNHDIGDVVAWSWILSANNVDLSYKRFIVFSRQQRARSFDLPLFIALQLLRAERVSPKVLVLFIGELEADLERKNRWNADSGPVLLIRLLRHARLVDVSLFERIADLAIRILPLDAELRYNDHVQRLSHFYNRFLSLLALPSPQNPYRAVDFQQRAQLKIVRYMMNSGHQIPLVREGYRALAKVQLMHKKTLEEQKWSSIKAPSWPPWRRDELGIDATIEYPGRMSRTSKVLGHLLEAGYGPDSMEQEAQILAGWDTDKSPTIQARRIIRRRPLSWLKAVLRNDNNSTTKIVDHHVWSARVAATRSVREAWVCFYSYLDATMDQKRELRVYHEMFLKLLARVQLSKPQKAPHPGDGKEIFPDPISPRDHAYVPQEPPSLEELYAQMLQDGVKPAGRLLANLIDGAKTLKQGLGYITDSSMDDVKKDVLLNPQNYPGNFIHRSFATTPAYLLASYIGLLTNRIPEDDVQLFWPGSQSVEERGRSPTGPTKPLLYGLMLLRLWEPTYLPAYHALLEGVCTQSKMRSDVLTKGSDSTRKHSYVELWKIAEYALKMIERRGLHPDLICFRKLIVLARNIMVRAPSQFRQVDGDFAGVQTTLRSVFMRAVGGTSVSSSLPSGERLKMGEQPYWKDVENLLIMSGLSQDYPLISELLRWMSAEHEFLDFVDAGGYKMQRLMCAARVALEASYSQDRSRSASPEQIKEVMKYAERWGWPEDVDVEEFLQQHRGWLNSRTV